MEINCFTCKYGGAEIEDCFTLVGNCNEDCNKWKPKGEKAVEVKPRPGEAYLGGFEDGYRKGLEKSLALLTDHRKMMMDPPTIYFCAKCGKEVKLL